MTALTKGAILKIIGNDNTLTPVIQILDIKKVTNAPKAGQAQSDRWRVVFTDGEYWMQGLLHSSVGELVKTNAILKNSVCRVTEYQPNVTCGKHVVVILKMTVVEQYSDPLTNTSDLKRIPAPSANNSAEPPKQQQPQRNNNSYNNRPAPPANNQPFHQRHNNSNSNNSRNRGGNRGGGSNNSNQDASTMATQPISSLNPYQNTWRIRVRCTAKSPMRHYHTQKSEGKLFSVDLLDEDGGEIRAVMFNTAADTFFTVFKEKQCYVISRGTVKVNKKGFSHIKNEYQIILNEDAQVLPVSDAAAILHQKFQFEKIGSLGKHAPGTFVDVIGIVSEVSDLSTIHSTKKQETYTKRELKIVDQTGKISLTVWGKDAEEFDEQKLANYKILALKGAKVQEFGGRSLSASGAVFLSPTNEEAIQLQSWFDAQGASGLAAVSDLTGTYAQTARKFISEIKDMEASGTLFDVEDNNRNHNNNNNNVQPQKKKAAYFTVVATITGISQSAERLPWYKAVPEGAESDQKFANAKVIDDGMGKWRCVKNNKVYDDYTPRYILRFGTCDFSGSMWMTAFNEHATTILGQKCKPVEQLHESGQTDAYQAVFDNATFKRYVFKVRCREDNWEDQKRVRYDVQSVTECKAEDEAEALADKISELQKLMPDILSLNAENDFNGHIGNANNNNNNIENNW